MNLLLILHFSNILFLTASLSQNMFSNVALLSKSGQLVKASEVLKGKKLHCTLPVRGVQCAATLPRY